MGSVPGQVYEFLNIYFVEFILLWINLITLLSVYYYLTDRYLIRCQNHVTKPDYSKGDVDPSNLEVSFVPNWMDQFQISKNSRIIEELASHHNLTREVELNPPSTDALKWPIQDLAEEGPQFLGCVPTYYFAFFFCKNCMKMNRILTRRGLACLLPYKKTNLSIVKATMFQVDAKKSPQSKNSVFHRRHSSCPRIPSLWTSLGSSTVKLNMSKMTEAKKSIRLWKYSRTRHLCLDTHPILMFKVMN